MSQSITNCLYVGLDVHKDSIDSPSALAGDAEDGACGPADRVSGVPVLMHEE
jgi:hypothetical protein